MPVMAKIDVRSRRIWVPALIFLLAAGVRLWSLSYPPTPYWDEQYYVFDASVYLGGGIGQPVGTPPAVKIADEGTWVHPPAGKWMIALLGVGPFGNRPLGWRVPSAVFGIAGVVLLYYLALELWASVWWAGLSALLLSTDGLHIVQSRISMLDIFLSTFITAGMFLLVLDRRHMPEPGGRRTPAWVTRFFGSWYRLGAGAAFGAAVATKWSGAFALTLGAILGAVWALRGAGAAGRTRWATVGTIAASFALAPLLVYLISYGAFFYQHGFAVRDFLTLQFRMLQYQQTHLKVQPQNSDPWTWPILLHPIQYTSLTRGTSTSRIVALGNPALWWGFIVLLPLALVQIVRRRAWQDAVAFGGYAAMFLPWFFVGRSQFIFYMLPAVPFMALGVAATLRRFPARWVMPSTVLFAGAAVACAAAFAPVWTGWWVSNSWSRALGWLPGWRP